MLRHVDERDAGHRWRGDLREVIRKGEKGDLRPEAHLRRPHGRRQSEFAVAVIETGTHDTRERDRHGAAG